MANKERGEFILLAGESKYLLRLTTNSCCDAETLANGREWDQILKGGNKGSVRDVRLLLWAALREHYPDLATEDQAGLKAAGRIIDDAGGMLGLLIQLKLFIALNADSGDADIGGARRPREAQAVGIGVSSISTLLASV